MSPTEHEAYKEAKLTNPLSSTTLSTYDQRDGTHMLHFTYVDTDRDGYEIPQNIHNLEMPIDRAPDDENVDTDRDGYEIPQNIHNFEMPIDRAPDDESIDGFGNTILADSNNGGDGYQRRQFNADRNVLRNTTPRNLQRPEYEMPFPYYTWTRPLVEPQPYGQNDEEETLPSDNSHLYNQLNGTQILYSPTKGQREVQRPRHPYENVVNETGV
jgi:hypothetical protein